MKKYYDKKTAPLFFHRLYHYIFLPVTSIYSLLLALRYLPGVTQEFVIAVLVLLFFGYAGLCIATFIGFFSWKRFAWRFVLMILALQFAYFLIATFLIVASGEFMLFVSVTMFLFFAGILYAIFVYYLKRKPLFFPTALPPVSERADMPPYDGNKACDKCGAWIFEPNAETCPLCGASTGTASQDTPTEP